VLAAMLLGACGRDDRGPFVDSRPPPGLAERFYPPENWAWGLLSADGGPAQRYGVAAPRGPSRAQVLIIPDYGESAETWFETARDLVGAGYTVWVLEGVGQGGSARLGAERDLGEVSSFDPDVAAVRGMIATVIRPSASEPLALVGQGVGALVAARAVETGARPAALILSAPACDAPARPSWLVSVGLGSLRAPGMQPWRRDGPDAFAEQRTHDAWRGGVTHAWQTANPDLRMGGPSLVWDVALADLQKKTRADLGALVVPAVVIDPAGRSACVDASAGARRVIPGAGRSLELEEESRRRLWLAGLRTVLERVASEAAVVGDHAS
jgi:lysophospholipase